MPFSKLLARLWQRLKNFLNVSCICDWPQQKLAGDGRSSPSLSGATLGVSRQSVTFCYCIPIAQYKKEMSISGKIIQKFTHSVYVLLLSIYSLSFSTPINDFTFLRIYLSPPSTFLHPFYLVRLLHQRWWKKFTTLSVGVNVIPTFSSSRKLFQIS
jgi:hypothetical protein